MGSKMINSNDKGTSARPEVLIVGTYHFTNNGDMMDNSTAIDIGNDQNQIRDLVDLLAIYSPSALAVEVTKDKNEALNEDYQAYLAGMDNLEENEIYKIMFRLGKQLGQDGIHAVDWMESLGNRGMGDVAQWAKEHQIDKYNKVMEIFSEDSIDADGSILDNIKRINDAAFAKHLHSGYMKVGQIGADEDYVGIDWLRWWYQRNLIIYKNVMDIIHSGNKKVMLFIGASHIYLLKQFIEESGEADVVTFNDFHNSMQQK